VVYVFKALTVREMSCVPKGVNVNEEECLLLDNKNSVKHLIKCFIHK